MTSGSYLCKSIKDNIRRNLYLMVLLGLGFLAVLPMGTVMQLEPYKNMKTAESILMMQKQFQECIGPSNDFLVVVIIAAGVLMGLAQFAYLYSGEKIDFYHSLPVKREDLFMSHFISGGISVLVPYLISVLLTLFAGAAYGAVTSDAVLLMAEAMGISMLYFLVFYSISILAVLLTGNLFMGVLGILGFLSYGPLAYGAYMEMNGRFFTTLSNWNPPAFYRYLSPVFSYLEIAARMDVYRGDYDSAAVTERGISGFVVYAVVLVLVLFAGNMMIYRKRPSEGFQKALAFEKLQPVIKIPVVILFSIIFGIFFSGGMSRRFLWLTVASLFFAVVLSAVFEFLYHMDLKKCIIPRISTGIVLGVLVLIFAGYRLDVLGVDTYLPDKDKIETMSVSINGINNNMPYPEGFNMWNIGNYLEKNRIKNFDTIYSVAEKGVQYCKDKKSGMIDDSNADQEQLHPRGYATLNIDVAYHLKNGKTVYRSYYMQETEEVLQDIGKIYDNWEYREKMLPTTYLDQNKIEYMYVTNFDASRKQLDLNKENMLNLYKTYKTELESMTFEQSRKERIIGYLETEYRVSWKDGIRSGLEFPIYESFEKTIHLIEKAGCRMPKAIDADGVSDITLSVYKNDGSGETVKTVLEEPTDMENVLRHLTFCREHYDVGSNIRYDISVIMNSKVRFSDTALDFCLMDSSELEPILKQLKID